MLEKTLVTTLLFLLTHGEDAISSWSPWSSCTRSCGGGTKTRSQTLLWPINYQTEEMVCNKICYNGGVFDTACTCVPGTYGPCCEGKEDHKGLDVDNIGLIVGSVIGVLLCVLAVAATVFVLYIRRENERETQLYTSRLPSASAPEEATYEELGEPQRRGDTAVPSTPGNGIQESDRSAVVSIHQYEYVLEDDQEYDDIDRKKSQILTDPDRQ